MPGTLNSWELEAGGSEVKFKAASYRPSGLHETLPHPHPHPEKDCLFSYSFDYSWIVGFGHPEANLLST